MKKKIILLPLLGLFAYAILSSNSGGPGMMSGVEATGASGVTTYCGGGSCHATAPSASTAVTIQLASGTTPVTSYTPGATYNIVISGVNTSSTAVLPKFGYQVAAVKSGSTVNAGTMTAPAGSHAVTALSINLIEHSSPLAPITGSGGAGTNYGVSIVWVAPVAGTGNVKFFGTLNAVDMSATSLGDAWNNATLIVPEATATSITGPSSVCAGATITLADAVTGGAWSSSNTGVATIGATSGVVSGVSAGTTTISYVAGASVSTTVITVKAAPVAITGATTVCAGATTTLADATTGGAWLSGSAAIAMVGSGTGVVTGVSAGTVLITYGLFPSLCYVTSPMTVMPGATPAAVTGISTVCVGTTNLLADVTTGGAWTSSNTAKATVSSTGMIYGVAVGTTVISYTTTNSCGTGSAMRTVTVNAAGSFCGSAVGTVPGSGEQGVFVFPNPNSGMFTMKLVSATNEPAHVVITNIMGATIKEFTTTTNSSTDLKLDAPSGLYFIRATNGQNKFVSKVTVQ